MDSVLSLILGGGLAGTLATLAKIWFDRKKLKQEASDRNLRTPAEVDSLVATTADTLVGSALELNAALRTYNQTLQENNTALIGRLENVEREVANQGEQFQAERRRTASMESALIQAYSWITQALEILEQHLPHVQIPTVPHGYRPPTREGDTQ